MSAPVNADAAGMNGAMSISVSRSVTATGNDRSTMTEHNLSRFIAAQAPIYDQAVAKLKSGCKRSHGMWFVFPQMAGLGHSATAAPARAIFTDAPERYFDGKDDDITLKLL